MKKEQEFLTNLKRSVEQAYPRWDWYKISDMPHAMGSRFDMQKPCDVMLHIESQGMIYYYPIEAKNVTGYERFDFSEVQPHQEAYLSKYFKHTNNTNSFIFVHYHIPRGRFFIVIPYMFFFMAKCAGLKSLKAKYLQDYPFKFTHWVDKKKVYFHIGTTAVMTLASVLTGGDSGSESWVKLNEFWRDMLDKETNG